MLDVEAQIFELDCAYAHTRTSIKIVEKRDDVSLSSDKGVQGHSIVDASIDRNV